MKLELRGQTVFLFIGTDVIDHMSFDEYQQIFGGDAALSLIRVLNLGDIRRDIRGE